MEFFLQRYGIKTAIFLRRFTDIELDIRCQRQYAGSLGKQLLQLLQPETWFAGILKGEKHTEAPVSIGKGAVLDFRRNDQYLIFIGPGLLPGGDPKGIACDEEDLICKMGMHCRLLSFGSRRVHDGKDIVDAKHL